MFLLGNENVYLKRPIYIYLIVLGTNLMHLPIKVQIIQHRHSINKSVFFNVWTVKLGLLSLIWLFYGLYFVSIYRILK